MDRREALSIYIRAILPERESWLYQRALGKVRGITRGMSDKELEDYLQSKAFSNTLYHVKKGDGAYQALLRGELTLDFHIAEFERLLPLILEDGGADLEFLRSVDRSRVTLKQARRALHLLEANAPRKRLEGRIKGLVDESEKRLERHLKRGDLSRRVKDAGQAEHLISHLMDTAFKKGVPDGVMEEAWKPGSLNGALRGALSQACPELNACADVLTPSGEPVRACVRRALDKAKREVCARVRKRFPEARVRRLLKENASIKQLQRQADAAFAKERRLRSALIDAIPEHYRDLYPLARQMKRRFILHLGPTNSGKTYEGVGRLRGARNGIYLGPLRLLAAEQFETLNLNDVPCSLVTGEEQILIPGSRVQSSTVEMADLKAHYDVAVID